MNTTSQILHDISARMKEALQGWQEFGGTDLREFLLSLVSMSDAEIILDVIDRISDADRMLRQSGLPPRVWAGERLQSIVPELVDEVLLGDLRGMDAVELGSRIIDLGLAGVSAFEDGDVKAVLSAGLQVAADGLPVATRFFLSPLGDTIERELVAIASAVVVGLSDPDSGEQIFDAATITGVVHLGLRVAKVGYKHQAGELDSDEALLELERAVATVAVGLAEHLVVQNLPEIGETVGIAIGTLVNNPVLGAVVGRTVGEFAAPVVRPLVQKGITALTRMAVRGVKPAVQGVIKRIKSALAE